VKINNTLLGVATITLGLILLGGLVYAGYNVGNTYYLASARKTAEVAGASSGTASSSSSVLKVSTDPIPKITPVKIKQSVKKGEIELSVIMYHHILGWAGAEGDGIEQGLRVSPAIFEKHLQYIKANKFSTITTKDLYQFAVGETTSLPANPILLTFDDGYTDNYELALPLLKKYSMVGDFAIITGVIGQKGYINWDQVRALVAGGGYVSSHTVYHCSLASKDKAGYPRVWLSTPVDDTDKLCSGHLSGEQLTSGQVRAELRQSKKIIEEQIGQPVYSIVYPFGGYNDTVVKIAIEESYALGFTVVGQGGGTIDIGDPLRIPRYRAFGQDDGVYLQGFFAGGR
jgi:peptidoglycan/xylan/chitin deacetylase (PgdA/CDA1 family)